MEENTNTQLDQATRYGLIFIALAQGWLLYFLYLTLDSHVWPATDWRWLISIYTVVVGGPAFFYLGLERIKDWRNLAACVVLLPLLFGLGWHLGWLLQEPGMKTSKTFEYGFTFLFSVGAALFILALYFRSWSFSAAQGSKSPRRGSSRGRRFDYGRLLEYSWQHALTLALLGLFVLVFWLLLFLWAMLFDVIGIDFFSELFEEPIFIYPITALVGSWGLILIRERIRLIATTRAMCEALIKALLPLAVLIAVLFLAALPFTGLQKIWDTGKAALLMMSLTLVVLFFFNAVLSDAPGRPAYPKWLRGFVLVGVALLPINSVLAAWALELRIEQYGLTVDRLWAFVLQFLIATFTLSYAVLILALRARALRAIEVANKWLALVMAGVLILINTPVADLRDWAAASQVDRLRNETVEPGAFDYRYLRFELGTYGTEELKRLQDSDFAASHPVVAQRVAAVLKQESAWTQTPVVDAADKAAVAGIIRVSPKGAEVPDGLLDQFVKDNPTCLTVPLRCQLTPVQTATGTGQWWGITRQNGNYLSGHVYVSQHGSWQLIGELSSSGCTGDGKPGVLTGETLRPVATSLFVYTNGACFFQVSPNPDYLDQLQQ